MRPLITLLLAALFSIPHSAVAQRISLGIVGGSTVTPDFSGSGTSVRRTATAPVSTMTQTVTSSSHQLVIGPKIEMSLVDGLSFEVDALRRSSDWQARYSINPPIDVNGTLTQNFFSRRSDVTWELPLLAKYRIPGLRALTGFAPFVEAGPSFRPWLYSQGDAHAGVTAGAGFRFTIHGFAIEPTARYTRWGTPRLNTPRAKVDQLELLVGVSAPASAGRPSLLGRGIRVGVIGGFGLLGDFQAKGGYSSARSKMIGVTAGADINERWSVAVDGTYRPRILSEAQRATVLTWEFPVLASYRLAPGRLSPFVEAGPSFRASGNRNNSRPSRFGVTAGLGVQAKWQAVRISPRIRYTYWTADPPSDYPPQQPFSRHNQADALIAFTF